MDHPTISAFARSPDRGRGLARDFRVRWALEEVGQPYNVRLLSFDAIKEPAHRALHPFGQIPTYEESDRSLATIVERDKSWYEERLPLLDDRVRVRLGELSSCLGDADWLDGTFSAGDLLMVTVLRRSIGWGLLEKHLNLLAYIARGEARPAYKRAFAAQLAVFTAQSPSG